MSIVLDRAITAEPPSKAADIRFRSQTFPFVKRPKAFSLLEKGDRFAVDEV